MLGDVNGELCRAYVRERGRQFAARRELEELRAAINYHHSEGLCQAIVAVVLPPKSEPRGRWLSRGEAARLIWSAWRYREIQKGYPTGRRARAHVDALLAAALKPAEGRPWIDLDRGVFYGRPSARRSKKRQPPIRIPTRLLAHMRRWRKNGQAYLIEFNGAPIGSIDKAFAANVDAVGLDADVVVHTTRHTAITWLAMGGVDPYEICRFAGITMEVFEDVYAHHHPDFMRGVERGYGAYRDRYRDRNDATEREQTAANVAKIADYSKAAR
jgi:integrase